MLNSEPIAPNASPPSEAELEAALRSGAMGAVVLAGLATAIVVAIWFLFYLLVFLPRVLTP
jgi:hypothetical protein